MTHLTWEFNDLWKSSLLDWCKWITGINDVVMNMKHGENTGQTWLHDQTQLAKNIGDPFYKGNYSNSLFSIIKYTLLLTLLLFLKITSFNPVTLSVSALFGYLKKIWQNMDFFFLSRSTSKIIFFSLPVTCWNAFETPA